LYRLVSVFQADAGTLYMNVWLLPRQEPLVSDRAFGWVDGAGIAEVQVSSTVTWARPFAYAGVTPMRRVCAAAARAAVSTCLGSSVLGCFGP
jgi:hypothetical protein